MTAGDPSDPDAQQQPADEVWRSQAGLLQLISMLGDEFGEEDEEGEEDDEDMGVMVMGDHEDGEWEDADDDDEPHGHGQGHGA